MEQNIPEPQTIGFLLQDECVIVSNPCTIPVDMIEKAIKEHKTRKDKKDVTHFFCIAIPIKKELKGVFKMGKLNGRAKRTRSK